MRTSLAFTLAVAVLSFNALTCRGADVYPSAYPFSNEDPEFMQVWESHEPPTNVEPKIGDENDPGGYINLLPKCNYTEMHDKYGSQNWSPARCDGFAHMRNFFLQSHEQSAASGAFFINCSGVGYPQFYGGAKNVDDVMKSMGSEKGMPSVMGKKFDKSGNPVQEDFCTTSEECCPEMAYGTKDGIKQATYVGVFGVTGPTFHDTYVTEYKKYQCTDNNPLYMCNHIYGFGGKWCMENYLSPTKRITTFPCPDVQSRFVFSCKVRMTTVSPARLSGPASYYEPKVFLDKLTAGQYERLEMTFMSPDYVCHPYSYYYPSTGKDAAKSSVQGSSASSVASSASPAASSASPTASSEQPAGTPATGTSAGHTVGVLSVLSLASFILV